jgi:hypothetical protein
MATIAWLHLSSSTKVAPVLCFVALTSWVQITYLPCAAQWIAEGNTAHLRTFMKAMCFFATSGPAPLPAPLAPAVAVHQVAAVVILLRRAGLFSVTRLTCITSQGAEFLVPGGLDNEWSIRDASAFRALVTIFSKVLYNFLDSRDNFFINYP